MYRLSLLLMVLLLTGCWDSSNPPSPPLTMQHVNDTLYRFGDDHRKETQKVVRDQMHAGLKPLEARMESLERVTGEHRDKVGELTMGFARNHEELINRLKAQKDLLDTINTRSMPPAPPLMTDPVPGGGSGKSEISITTGGQVTTKITVKGPGSTLAEAERILKEQQDRRERDRELLFLRGQLSRERLQAEAMEDRVTNLETTLGLEVAKINRQITALDIRFTNKDAECKRLLEELAARCRATTVLYCAPPATVRTYPCYSYRVGCHGRCLYVW